MMLTTNKNKTNMFKNQINIIHDTIHKITSDHS